MANRAVIGFFMGRGLIGGYFGIFKGGLNGGLLTPLGRSLGTLF